MYQTVTTVATVGFREIKPLSSAGMVFTMVLIIVGVGTVLYNLGVIVESVTEGHLREYLERRRMDQRISSLSGHIIICGFGRVGRSAAEHLRSIGHEVVVIDRNPDRLVGVEVPHLVADALDDTTLLEAGIVRARALIAALEQDADTVYLTLSARALRSDLVIVARARTVDSKAKLVLAGATRAVNPQLIGGAGWRPSPCTRRRGVPRRRHARRGSRLPHRAGPRPGHVAARRAGPGGPRPCRAVGRAAPGGPYAAPGRLRAQPPPGTVLQPGSTLIIFGDPGQVSALHRLVEPGQTAQA